MEPICRAINLPEVDDASSIIQGDDAILFKPIVEAVEEVTPETTKAKSGKTKVTPETPKAKAVKGKSQEDHWLNITDQYGNPLSLNVQPMKRTEGYYELSQNGELVHQSDYLINENWFRVKCKYCNDLLQRFELRSHYLELHLHAIQANWFTYPNVFTLNPLPFKAILPSSDSWPIDFSTVVQDDPLLKMDQITYPSNFYTDDESPSCSFFNEFLSCFHYSFERITSNRIIQFRFDYACQICKEEISSTSLNCFKLAVLVHLRVIHRNNPVLVKMCEDEMYAYILLDETIFNQIVRFFSRFFNEAYGVKFQLFVDLKEGPRLPSDLLLTGPEAEFIRANAYGDYDVNNRFYPCKLCLTYYNDLLDFKKHLTKVHSIASIVFIHDFPMLVKHEQIVMGKAFHDINSWFTLAFAKKEDKFVWACYDCDLVFEESQIGHLFAKIGTHFTSKGIERTNIPRSYTLLTQCSSYSEMKTHYQTLQCNCRTLQKKLKLMNIQFTNVERKCVYCGKKYSLPQLLTEETAEFLHLLIEHSNIQSIATAIRCLVNSNASNEFPFLDTCFEDIIEKKPSDRRFRCSRCMVIFENYQEFLVHAKLHYDRLPFDPERFFFKLSSEVLNYVLENGIQGVYSNTTFQSYDSDIFVCTTCLEVMNSNGMVDGVKMAEHIKTCNYKSLSTSDEPLPVELKETTSRQYRMKKYLCNTCGKTSVTEQLSKYCCIFGQPLPVYQSKSKEEEWSHSQRIDGIEPKTFNFKIFSL